MLRSSVRALDERTGAAPFIQKALRYAFPDHWSFLLGEVALYSFIVLVATGIYLTFFFEPSTASTVYHGSYGPLDGVEMSRAYRSVLDISFGVKAGLLMRQTHHWAATAFVGPLRRRCRGALPHARPPPDQPVLALGPLPRSAGDERRAARLVPRLADRGAAARAELRRRDREPDGRAESVLGRGLVRTGPPHTAR